MGIVKHQCDKAICVVCKGIFYTTKNIAKAYKSRPVGVRPRHAVTCSTKCSKIHRGKKMKCAKCKKTINHNLGIDLCLKCLKKK